MISQSSLAAYNEIMSDGKSETQLKTILNLLNVWDEPLSASEIKQQTGLEINAVSGRINDLKKMGVVVECDRRPCSITNRLITPVFFSRDL